MDIYSIKGNYGRYCDEHESNEKLIEIREALLSKIRNIEEILKNMEEKKDDLEEELDGQYTKLEENRKRILEEFREEHVEN